MREESPEYHLLRTETRDNHDTIGTHLLHLLDDPIPRRGNRKNQTRL